MTTLQLCLLFSTILFGIGLAAALSRGSAIFVLLGVELMLNAANINFIAFWRFPLGDPVISCMFIPIGGSMEAALARQAAKDAAEAATAAAGNGVLFALFSIAIAAAEAAVGLALIIAIYRARRSIRLQDAVALRG